MEYETISYLNVQNIDDIRSMTTSEEVADTAIALRDRLELTDRERDIALYAVLRTQPKLFLAFCRN